MSKPGMVAHDNSCLQPHHITHCKAMSTLDMCFSESINTFVGMNLNLHIDKVAVLQ